MISFREFTDEGFFYYSDLDEWERDGLRLTADNGIVTFVRENDNYHGINVWITSVEQLRIFLSFRR